MMQSPLEDALRDFLNSNPYLKPIHQSLINSALYLVHELTKVRYDGLHPRESRSSLITTLARIVQESTLADCVFVRRVNSDGSLELMGEPLWRNGRSVGTPPRVKQQGEGISGWAVAHTDGKPLVVRDINDAGLDANLRQSHRLSLSAHEDEEARFIGFIRAEVCVPLFIEGRAVAAIVAVRGQPYQEEEVVWIEKMLKYWGDILVPLYGLASVFAEFDEQQYRLRQLVKALPLIAPEPDDDLFLRKLATVLTCHQGVGWHRAMLFLFRGPYPADAECVMGVGSTGEMEWSENQTRLSSSVEDLEDYLSVCTHESYGADDFLYQMVRKEERWVIPRQVFVEDGRLHRLFLGDRNELPPPDGVVPLTPEDPWLRKIQVNEFAAAFQDCAANCDHWLVPLIWLVPTAGDDADRSPGRVLGFVLLDRPYPHHIEPPHQLALTRLVCDLFAGLIATRPRRPFPLRAPQSAAHGAAALELGS
jgi:hypothetical protein